MSMISFNDVFYFFFSTLKNDNSSLSFLFPKLMIDNWLIETRDIIILIRLNVSYI